MLNAERRCTSNAWQVVISFRITRICIAIVLHDESGGASDSERHMGGFRIHPIGQAGQYHQDQLCSTALSLDHICLDQCCEEEIEGQAVLFIFDRSRR